MKAVKILGANDYIKANEGLPGIWVERVVGGANGSAVYTAFLPSEEERNRIANGEAIIVHVMGRIQPPLGVMVGEYEKEN